jgi:hypothetical protein
VSARWAAPRQRRALGGAVVHWVKSGLARAGTSGWRTEEAGRARRRRFGAHLRNRDRGKRGRALDADGDEASSEHCGAHDYRERRPRPRESFS